MIATFCSPQWHGAIAVAAMVLALLCGAPARADGPWRPHEIAAVVGLGPWPPEPPRDPSNRFMGDPVAIEFGRRLFFDARLSRFGVIACASCHKPERAWTDGRIRASAAAGLDRNTPTLLDVGYQRTFGWDGGHDSLWSQSIRPILDPREMGARADDVVALVGDDPDYGPTYRDLAGTGPAADDAEKLLVTVAKALAAFQATLVSGRTAFDRARDLIAAGITPEASGLSPSALRGLRLFIGGAGCVACHSGPRFTDDGFHAVLPLVAVQGGRLDRGRPDALAGLAASPYRRDGAHGDARAADPPTPSPAAADRVPGAFRTPSLRAVTLTGPYMHDGRHGTLREAVAHGPNAARLSMADRDDLAAFLSTLAP